jgi:very-short-patch-repair endonuclease
MEPAGPNNNWNYNKKLRPLAKALRKNMTKAEACLWKYGLKARNMNGYSFSRQRPVMDYIVDFICKDLNLVIEIDGVTHLDEEVRIKDELKDQELKMMGFYVLRFRDEEVLNRIDLVLNDIEKTIVNLSQNNSTPFNSPSRGI